MQQRELSANASFAQHNHIKITLFYFSSWKRSPVFPYQLVCALCFVPDAITNPMKCFSFSYFSLLLLVKSFRFLVSPFIRWIYFFHLSNHPFDCHTIVFFAPHKMLVNVWLKYKMEIFSPNTRRLTNFKSHEYRTQQFQIFTYTYIIIVYLFCSRSQNIFIDLNRWIVFGYEWMVLLRKLPLSTLLLSTLNADFVTQWISEHYLLSTLIFSVYILRLASSAASLFLWDFF